MEAQTLIFILFIYLFVTVEFIFFQFSILSLERRLEPNRWADFLFTLASL